MEKDIKHTKCQLKEDSWLTTQFGYNFRSIFKVIKNLTVVSESCARQSLCFRTRASIRSEKIRHTKMNNFIIHPFSQFRFIWETWMIFVYFTSFFFIPYEACNTFYARLNKKLFVHYGKPLVSLHAIFIVDMVLNFFTGYVESKRKKVVLKWKLVAFKYMKTFLIIDILATVPALMNGFALYYGNGKVLYDRMLILNFFKIVRLPTYTKYASRLVYRYGLQGMMYKIVRFIIRSLFFFHWVACLLFLIPFTFTNNKITVFSANTWIHTIQSNIQKLSNGRFYLSSLFNAINLTLSCAAMRRPQSLNDFLIYIFYAILGVGYNCYLFIQLLDIIRSVMEPETKYDEFITQLRDYMRHNQLPSNIQQRMYLFFEHRYQRVYFKEDAIMNTLSDRMCKDITDYGRRRMVLKTKIFNGLAQDIIEEIINQLVLKVYLPKDIICKARSLSRHVFFLSSGTVAVYTVSGKEVGHMYDGAYFGELALLMKDHKMIAYISALEICEVYLLDREVFLKAVASNPVIFEQVVETAKQRIKETRAVEAAQRSVYEENPMKSDVLLV